MKNAADFGKQAVFLDGIDTTANPPVPGRTLSELEASKAAGVRIIASPIWALLAVDAAGTVVPSQCAVDIRAVGLGIAAPAASSRTP